MVSGRIGRAVCWGHVFERTSMSLTFEQFRKANVNRNAQSFPGCNEWEGVDWGNALAGEVGEACNVVKKIKRDGYSVNRVDALEKELADVVCYADLLASHYGIDLGEAVRSKFNEVSDRVNSPIKL